MHMTVMLVCLVMINALVVVGSPVPWCRVHALIHINVLCIEMTVKMDNADIAIYVRSHATYIWITQTMVTTDDNRKHAGCINV